MEIAARILVFILRIIGFLATPILKLFYPKHQSLPGTEESLLLRSATRLVAEIKSGKVKSSELVEAYIKRILEVNPIINAVVEDRFEEARKEALLVDKLVEEANEEDLEKFPLLGIPVTAKESSAVKGLSHTCGDPYRVDVKAPEDGRSIKRLREAGAIILCVTNLPEWVIGWESCNPIFGRTLNPFDNRRTTSGSSGGEAALITSCGSLVGLGSDLAGSIRTPAAFNGVFGHKPTPRTTSLEGFWPMVDNPEFDFFHNFGPLTRYAEDLELMLGVLAGPETASKLQLHEKVAVKSLKVYFMEDFGKSYALKPVKRYVRDLIRKAVKHLKEEHGCDTQELPNEVMAEAFEVCSRKLFHLTGVPELLNKPGEVEPRSLVLECVKHFFRRSKHTFGALYFWSLMKIKNVIVRESKLEYYDKKCHDMDQYLRKFLGDRNSVLIVPTYTKIAFFHFLLPPHISCLIYTTIFNVLGYPATHVPMGLVEGMPVGVQVVAAPHQDRLCLAVARQLELAFGGWKSPS